MENKTLELVKALYGASPSPVFVCDEHLNVLWSNSEAARTAVNITETQPHRLSSIFADVDFSDISQMIAEGKSCSIKFSHASVYQIEFAFQPIADDGHFLAVVSIHYSKDATRNFANMEALAAINSQSYRSAMFAIFNIISVLANTFDKKDMYDELAYLNSLAYSCYSIMRTNINIGEHSNHISRGMTLNRERISLNKFCRVLADNAERILGSSGIEFRSNITDEPIYTMADAGKLSIALLNAIHNSCAFSDLNNVVTLSLAKQGNSFVFSVSDKGVGIPTEELPYVFDPFYTNTQKAAFGTGNGLGLTVVKEIIEAHGGVCFITSEPYHGTTLSMRCPIQDDPMRELALSVPPSPYLTKRLSTENIFLAEIGKSVPF